MIKEILYYHTLVCLNFKLVYCFAELEDTNQKLVAEGVTRLSQSPISKLVRRSKTTGAMDVIFLPFLRASKSL